MECTLLRVVDFKLDLDLSLPNQMYVKRYSQYLYEPNYHGNFAQIEKCATAIANDSFFTYINCLYNVQTVALACVFLAASRYKFITPMTEDSTIQFNFDGCFHMFKARR